MVTEYDIEKLKQCADKAEQFLTFMKGGNSMARPKTDKISHALNIRIDDELMQQIKAVSDKLESEGLKLPLAAVVRRLLVKGVEHEHIS
jgi:hypothetical protein